MSGVRVGALGWRLQGQGGGLGVGGLGSSRSVVRVRGSWGGGSRVRVGEFGIAHVGTPYTGRDRV